MRRNKTTSIPPYMNVAGEDNEQPNNMNTWSIWFKRHAMKKIVKFISISVIVFILWKLYLFWSYSGAAPTRHFPSHHSSQKAKPWQYSSNPQGIDKEGLNELMSNITAGTYTGLGNYIESEKYDLKSLKKVEKTYRSDGSLTFKRGELYLDGKQFRLLSGAMHYFRVVPEYWRDRFRKMKACGLNSIETYVSWNLHEETPGHFNFDGMLDIRKYIQIAAEEGLYVILRPGPYICSEWDFGGMPAWLLKDPNMKVRTNYKPYQAAVERFFHELIPQVVDLQHTNGGPIIAVQIENEFGSYSSEVQHLLFIKNLLIQLDIKELMFVSDGLVKGKTGFHVAPFYDETLPTVNFNNIHHGLGLFDLVQKIDPEFPLIVMEFWSGWFDHWGKPHAHNTVTKMTESLREILRSGASVNFYMFHGGTNFGFTAGANWFIDKNYEPTVTSYDYIAPLSEAGDITPKYEVIRALLQKMVREPMGLPPLPDIPPNTLKADYGEVAIQKLLTLEDMVASLKRVSSEKPLTMEQLSINNGYGQNYGFILYRTYIPKGKKLRFSAPAHDRAIVIVNGLEIETLSWLSSTWQVWLPQYKLNDQNLLEILVEHQGRVNYVHQGYNKYNEERKGITGDVYLDDKPIKDWKIFPLEFTTPYINKMVDNHNWKPYTNTGIGLTSMYKGNLIINEIPKDTFLNLQQWNKGVAFVNGFNLGRYWSQGPQGTLFVPAPVLKSGVNVVVIFELYRAAHTVTFQDYPLRNIHKIEDE